MRRAFHAAAGAAMMYIFAQVNEWALAYASQTLICSAWGCACVYLFYDGVVTAADLRNSEVRVRDLSARLDAKDLSSTLIAKKLDDNYQLMLENRKRLLSIQRHNNHNNNNRDHNNNSRCGNNNDDGGDNNNIQSNNNSNSLDGGSGEFLLFTKEYEKKSAESGIPKQKHPPAPQPLLLSPAAAANKIIVEARRQLTAPGGVFTRSASDITITTPTTDGI